jgi:hypothetical protein
MKIYIYIMGFFFEKNSKFFYFNKKRNNYKI